MGQVQRNDCVGSIEGGYMHEIKKKWVRILIIFIVVGMVWNMKLEVSGMGSGK